MFFLAGVVLICRRNGGLDRGALLATLRETLDVRPAVVLLPALHVQAAYAVPLVV